MNDESLYGWRLVAGAILASAGGLMIAVAFLTTGGSPAAFIGFLFIVAGVLMLPTIFEHAVALGKLPFALMHAIYGFLRALDNASRSSKPQSD